MSSEAEPPMFLLPAGSAERANFTSVTSTSVIELLNGVRCKAQPTTLPELLRLSEPSVCCCGVLSLIWKMLKRLALKTGLDVTVWC